VSLRIAAWSGPAEAWDAFGEAQQGWTHFHRHGWRDVIASVHGHECPYLAAYDGERLAGVLPLVRVKTALFGHYLVSMPFLNYGGPLGEPAAVRALAAEAARLARAGNAKLLELRSAVELPVDLAVSHRKITVMLDLVPGDAGAVFNAFKGKLRSQIRRPQKEGVTVRFGPDQLGPFYDVFAHHMRDLGTPVQPRAMFERIAGTFPDDAWFGCAYLGNRPVACGAGFRWDSQFEMTWASALTEFQSLAPNMMLYWAFIERAAAEGLALFNFGRCTPGSGTHRFKLQWGGRDVPLYWYQAGEAGATPSPDQAAYAWGPRLWRRLPVRVASALGPLIVRGIP
jgi:FemAB-related protein (PEP-CTERM system-associated)